MVVVHHMLSIWHELVVRYKNNRKAINAISLTTDTSNLTAIGNDMTLNIYSLDN